MAGTYKPDRIPAKWRELLLLIPGYSSIATAGDCVFDVKAAKLALDFFPECLRHIEGKIAGKPFVLEPFQQSQIANLFGWKRRNAKGKLVRRYREVLDYEPRKNGKTPKVAGLALSVLFVDKELGQQNYIAAADKEQAGLLFRHCKGMVEAEPELDGRCRTYGGTATAGQSRSIVRSDDGSFLRIISADADTKHGGNPHLVIIDELHAQPNRELVDVLTTSMASENREESLLIFITTADYDRPSICNEKYEYACKVRDGVVDDPSFLPIIYEAARTDDWTKEETWRKANPNLGVSVSLDFLRRECKRAQETPAYENTFRRLHLNQITTTANKCIPLDQWDACAHPIDWQTFAGREVHAALDIGATSDFTALPLLFPHDDAEEIEITVERGEAAAIDKIHENVREIIEELNEKGVLDSSAPVTRKIVRRSYSLRMFFWLPEEPIKRNHRMQSVIDGWIKEGLIRVTPGNVVDYDIVLEDIIEILSPYELIDIAFDRGFQGGQMGTNLMKHFGDKVFQFPQGILSMAAPFREFLELVSVGRLHHDGNKVMRWMVSNVVPESRGGLIKPSKDKSPEKIDGVTGACMSIGRALHAVANSPKSVYDTRDILVI